MRKIIFLAILCLSFTAVFTLNANAKEKDSLSKGYNVWFNSDQQKPSGIDAYNKPGGKKIDRIKSDVKYWYDWQGDREWRDGINYLTVEKVINPNWAKVKYTNNGSKNPKYKTAFVKTKYFRANLNGADYAVVKVKSLNLRMKPNATSKVITQIPLGVQLEYYYGKGNNENPFKYDKGKNGWIKVKYVKKGKKYIGYVKTSHTY